MKSLFTFTFLILISISSYGQGKIEKLKNQVLKEGFLLYESEKASWHGSDFFLEKFTDRSKIGGYVSYTDGNNPKCVFFSKEDNNKVIGTITFDANFNLSNVTTDLTERPVSDLEKEYLDLRVKAYDRINNDTIFKHYKNTNYNIVPLISGKEKRVYVLTASTENGKIVIGNDYLIEFNSKGDVKKTERLHKGMLLFEFGDKEKKIVGASHSHLPEYNEIITPTDICTSMLYQDFTHWETHTVISKKYVSIWNCEKRELVIITKKAWERISKN
jgi:hypothetical protein